jgi:hypothetical protein
VDSIRQRTTAYHGPASFSIISTRSACRLYRGRSVAGKASLIPTCWPIFRARAGHIVIDGTYDWCVYLHQSDGPVIDLAMMYIMAPACARHVCSTTCPSHGFHPVFCRRSRTAKPSWKTKTAVAKIRLHAASNI